MTSTGKRVSTRLIARTANFSMSVTGKIKIFSGNAHPALAEEICGHLDCDLGKASTERFSDGEFNFQIGENVRGSRCVHRAADMSADRSALDGIADNDRRFRPSIGGASNGGHSVFWLRTVG